MSKQSNTDCIGTDIIATEVLEKGRRAEGGREQESNNDYCTTDGQRVGEGSTLQRSIICSNGRKNSDWNEKLFISSICKNFSLRFFRSTTISCATLLSGRHPCFIKNAASIFQIETHSILTRFMLYVARETSWFLLHRRGACVEISSSAVVTKALTRSKMESMLRSTLPWKICVWGLKND